ncbi:hypothetical protein B5X24_HaOG202628 [Helicoverpa armigera]|uniref:Uncharacterized protein n=1 Tax=Helicoverpa armigera TaxID=29058 RepID=A0A2W1C1W3_HELAM|nr:hypothetical protein B5X24_HaOG202628 [Helicoverpa armigera]
MNESIGSPEYRTIRYLEPGITFALHINLQKANNSQSKARHCKVINARKSQGFQLEHWNMENKMMSGDAITQNLLRK